ncbi:thiamine-phosphate kinase [Candidatus Roizmanbacteria bacterium]|nr:thiamine-phosphate kinase [Candidatus Roizmanbacteria bacterium]
MKANKLTEFFLIDRISNKFKEYRTEVIKGIGDDAAVVKINSKRYVLYTCDALVAGVHFSEKYFSPYQIGRKAAAVNLSDIAAMGGVPKHLLISLFLPKGTTEQFIGELYKGLIDECKKYDVDIIGGNISKNNQFIIDVFLTGEISSKNIVLRSGAQIGDAVAVTGTLGDAFTGLKLLQNHSKGKEISNNFKKKFISKHLMPIPRVKEGILIAQSGKVNSMIDISDGLSSDIGHICDESNLGVKIFLENLPVSNGVNKLTALNGGEDYELCFTASFKNIQYLSQILKKSTGTDITIIGEIIPPKNGRWIIDKKGRKKLLRPQGWDHFA